MVQVAILGATGYTALELIKILLRHPDVKITALTTRQEGAPPIHTIHQALYGRLDVKCEDLTPAQVAKRAEVVFCCLPHVASMEAVPTLLAGGCKVIDLSADYRLRDPAVYEKWYGHAHSDVGRLKDTVYGLPEVWAERIPGQKLIANPGCYTSASILGLAPLLKTGWIEPTGIVIDAKSGVTGAGRTAKLSNLFSECNEAVAAYSVGNRHRHLPEIEQVLTDATGATVEAIFTPHLIPMDRGIIATMYAKLTKPATDAELLAAVRQFYAGKPFMRVVEHLPSTKDSAHTNYCDITVRQARGQAIMISCLDNLIKGAAGVAVQNFNLMCGFGETVGLIV
ncbi:MAG TPA: N-acetyl-gamma-glutamyl-phosphate reductase [Planctomycetaceae bacterium]|jgi:N-acetyl-gamma-glutamyl-phosphate reductase|nr:N-acetyl-gamma-glutamyl-phosphate reductase [Planctomycetaceae bacterium]